MSTYTKVYMRNKKESNISLPLRYSLLRSIFVDNMSVKNVSLPPLRQPSSGRSTTPPPKSSPAPPRGTSSTSSSTTSTPCPTRPNRPPTGRSTPRSPSKRSKATPTTPTTPTTRTASRTSRSSPKSESKSAAPSAGPTSRGAASPHLDITHLFFATSPAYPTYPISMGESGILQGILR